MIEQLIAGVVICAGFYLFMDPPPKHSAFCAAITGAYLFMQWFC